MTMLPDTCPWNVPVRVEAASFVPLSAVHAELNVRTASSPAFDSQVQPRASHELLYADLQTPLYSHVSGRLGSGRSGFYRGWYLKGIGRTPLAANWNRGDHLHSSGHLAASAAIREYVASLYVTQQGSADTIVPCDGVLVAELCPELRHYRSNLYGSMPDDLVPPVDRRLQAITVKPGEFARQSNFVWLLHHLTPARVDDGNSSLATFCDLLAISLAPVQSASATATTTPDQLAGLLASAVRATFERFRRWFEGGVWWGSFGNNFTIDGRFLDLETPTLFGGPFIGYLAASEGGAPRRPRRGLVLGFEQLDFLAQTRAFCAELVRVLAALPRYFDPIEREFGAALASEIEAQLLAPDELLGSRDLARHRILEMLESAFGRLADEDRTAIDRLVTAAYDRRSGEGCSAGQIDPDRSPVPGLRSVLVEPGLRREPQAIVLPSGRRLEPSQDQIRSANRWASAIAELDQATSLDRLLEGLAALDPRPRARETPP
jgi:hypothetical protein